MTLTTMPRRTHVSNSSWIAAVLRRHSTLHTDAWLLEDSDGVLWLRVLTSKGGVRMLKEDWLQVALGKTPPLWRVPDIRRHPDVRTCTERYLRSRWSLEDGGWRDNWLNILHWSVLQPAFAAMPEGYKWSSIACHYIRAASVDPVEGMENWMAYGKGGHRGPRGKGEPKPSVTARFDRIDALGGNMSVVTVHDDGTVTERPLASLDGLL